MPSAASMSPPPPSSPSPPAVPAGVVWLASYPKSGNTWLRILLSNLLEDGDAPQDINDLRLRNGIAADRWTFDDLTLLESRLLRDDEVERLCPAVHDAFAAECAAAAFVKVHNAYVRLDDGMPLLGRCGRAAVYLVRDPRDVAVSYAFHNDCDLARAIADLNNPAHALEGKRHQQTRQRLLDWGGHAASWLDQSDLPVHLLRYEDLLADTAAAFGRVLDFLGVTADADRIVRAARHADFSELQRQERRGGFAERVGSAPFFRRGQAGGWRECLTPAQVRAIEDAQGPAMDRLGYRRETTG